MPKHLGKGINMQKSGLTDLEAQALAMLDSGEDRMSFLHGFRCAAVYLGIYGWKPFDAADQMTWPNIAEWVLIQIENDDVPEGHSVSIGLHMPGQHVFHVALAYPAGYPLNESYVKAWRQLPQGLFNFQRP